MSTLFLQSSSCVCFATPVAVGTGASHCQFRSSAFSGRRSHATRPRVTPRRRRVAPPHATATTTVPGNSSSSALGDGDSGTQASRDSSTSFDLPPVFSAQKTDSALGTLVNYFNQLSKQQPFIRRRLFLSLVCIFASKIIGVTVPFYFKQAVDSLMITTSATAAGRQAARSAIIAIILHGIARVLASVTHELRNVVFAKGGQRVGRSATANAFAHLHSLEVAFHTGNHTGAVSRVVDRGTRAIMTIFRAMVFSFFPSFFELFLVCVVLFTKFSTAYVITTLLAFAVFTAWTLSINTTMGRVRTELNQTENEASAKLTDSLMNVEAVKVYNNARYETQRYDLSLEKFEAISIQNEKLFAWLNIGQTAAYTAGLTALLLLATNDVLSGSITVGSVVLLTTMLQRLWIPLNFLGWQYREVKQSIIDVQNLFDILRRQPAVNDRPGSMPLAVSEGRIDFENVSFTYPIGDNALSFASKKSQLDAEGSEHSESATGNGNSHTKRARRRGAITDLSFSVPGGSSVALVGASGSGKSTATRLLCRLYDVGSGQILIDGQDITNASLSSLRKAVSIVPQDTALFNDTIAYNIRYGRPSATDEEVVEAAKAASIHKVIMRTEHGYDTLVGERGVKLSGGERQRLSVARAFLKGSQIIIEDESTSALDTFTEMEVSKSLQKLGLNRTRMIVAHRLSTIMNVDQVIVMKGGRVAEQGTFNELVRRPDGIFRGMWERQQRKEVRAGEDVEYDEEAEKTMLIDDVDGAAQEENGNGNGHENGNGKWNDAIDIDASAAQASGGEERGRRA